MSDDGPRFKMTLPWFAYLTLSFVVWALIIGAIDGDETVGGRVVGTYNPITGKITAETDGRTPKEVVRTCAHEVGHYVWWEYLSEAERAEYETIYDASTRFVSDYAFTGGVDEDFAETYKASVTCVFDPSFVPDDRQEFFQDHVAWAWRAVPITE